MTPSTLRKAALGGVAATIFGAGAALAHHGWAWVSEDPFILVGTIDEIYLGNPHALLRVTADDGQWDVDLAPPAATAAAGFVEGVAAIGDTVTAYGHRSLDPDDLTMKAVRIEVNGGTYDVYPDLTDPFDTM